MREKNLSLWSLTGRDEGVTKQVLEKHFNMNAGELMNKQNNFALIKVRSSKIYFSVTYKNVFRM